METPKTVLYLYTQVRYLRVPILVPWSLVAPARCCARLPEISGHVLVIE